LSAASSFFFSLPTKENDCGRFDVVVLLFAFKYEDDETRSTIVIARCSFCCSRREEEERF
jgi:hypothetical protein